MNEFFITHFIPGRQVFIYWINQHMNILGGHITLRQQKYLFAGCILGHINNHYSMAGKTSPDNYITGLYGNKAGNRIKLFG